MYLYVIFFILFFFSFVEIDYGKKSIIAQISFLSILMILFLLSFLRWEVGTDWASYLSYFNGLSDWSDVIGDFEIGYDSIAKFTKLNLDGSYTLFLFFLALILYYTYYKSLRFLSEYPILSLFTLYSFSFAGIFFVRQTIAVAFILLSIQFIIQKRFILFCIIVLMAMSFHRTAIVFFPAYFIFNLQLSRLKILLFITCFFTIGYIFANSIIGEIAQIWGGIIAQKADAYQEAGLDTSGNFSALQTMIRGSSYRIAFIIFVIIFMYKFYLSDPIYRGMLNLYLFGALIFLITVPLSTAFIRLSSYYEITQVFLYPYILNLCDKKITKYLCICLLMGYFLFRFYGVVFMYEEEYIPYKSIF